MMRGKPPAIDLVVSYQKANTSAVLRLFVSRLQELVDPEHAMHNTPCIERVARRQAG